MTKMVSDFRDQHPLRSSSSISKKSVLIELYVYDKMSAVTYSLEQQLIELRGKINSPQLTFAEEKYLAPSATALETVWSEYIHRGYVPHWYQKAVTEQG